MLLEGGGMRGAYTSGVLDCFLDENLYFEKIFGVSAGGCNAVSYISRQRGRNIYILKEFSQDKRYVDPKGILTRGSVFGMDFVFREIPDKLVYLDYDRYVASKTQLYIVSTDCDTGRPDVRMTLDARDSLSYLMGSSSIPLFSQMVAVDGKLLVDGSASESIPLLSALARGITRPVIVLTRPAGYRKHKSRTDKLVAVKYRRFPNLVKSLQHRYLTYNKSIEDCEALEREGKAVIIRPSQPVAVGNFEKDPEKLQQLYQNGYDDAKAAIEKILRLCAAPGCDVQGLKDLSNLTDEQLLPGLHRQEAEGPGKPYLRSSKEAESRRRFRKSV